MWGACRAGRMDCHRGVRASVTGPIASGCVAGRRDRRPGQRDEHQQGPLHAHHEAVDGRPFRGDERFHTVTLSSVGSRAEYPRRRSPFGLRSLRGTVHSASAFVLTSAAFDGGAPSATEALAGLHRVRSRADLKVHETEPALEPRRFRAALRPVAQSSSALSAGRRPSRSASVVAPGAPLLRDLDVGLGVRIELASLSLPMGGLRPRNGVILFVTSSLFQTTEGTFPE